MVMGFGMRGRVWRPQAEALARRPGGLASAAKARVSDTGILVGCEAVQMFGGIGMTDEEEIGLFLKRLHAAAVTLGDASYHRSQFADQSGF